MCVNVLITIFNKAHCSRHKKIIHGFVKKKKYTWRNLLLLLLYDLSMAVFNFKKQLRLCDRDYSFLCVTSDKDYLEYDDLNKQFRIYLETCID